MKKNKLTISQWFSLVKDSILREALLKNYNEHLIDEPISVREALKKKKLNNLSTAILWAFTWDNISYSPTGERYTSRKKRESREIEWDRIRSKANAEEIPLFSEEQTDIISLWL